VVSAKRVDANQPEIVAALRQAGCSVQHLHEVGRGCVDLMVGYRGHTYCLEVKSEKGKLTPAEAGWHDEWKGHVAIVHTVDEALDVVRAI